MYIKSQNLKIIKNIDDNNNNRNSNNTKSNYFILISCNSGKEAFLIIKLTLLPYVKFALIYRYFETKEEILQYIL